MLTIIFLFFTVLGAAALTAWIRSYALRHSILDVPNARSSHSVATPRGGGVAIVFTVILAVLFAGISGWIDQQLVFALLFGAILVAGIGWLDDRNHIPARWRILVHLVAASWVVTGPGQVTALPIPNGEFALGWVAAPLGVLWMVWVLNLYNFMDGIDGIAGIEAVTVSMVAAAVLWYVQQPGLAFVVASIGAASLGFLAWNWPPAKVFMGDAGSAFLGFTFGSLALITHELGALVIWSWLILLGVFLVDATVTLMRRLMRGERVYEAHCSHAYQHAARRLGSHRTVTMAVGLINVAWLAPLALLAASYPHWGIALVVVAWAPLLVMVIKFQAGRPEIGRA
jgi:Fuc2NAc and GlcNAc transferase